MTSHTVEARGLEKRFGAVIALRGVDFEAQAGSLQVVLGPNGAGKSTLLRILAGLSQPTRGEVEITDAHGEQRPPRAARSQVGYVGHATLLYPELTARENLIFAAKLYGVSDREERAARLLADEGLSEFADRRAGTFSRGMAQRLSIARAVVHAPPLVLLDEPFTGLDRRSANRLAERLDEMRARGQSLVLITHDLHQAAELADCVHFMLRGRIERRREADGLSAAALEAEYLDVIESRLQGQDASTPGGGR